MSIRESQTNTGKSNIQARERAISLFHHTYAHTRAYRDYVDKHNVDVSQIQNAADFERIPIMTKKGYVYQYPLEDRLANGQTLADCYMLTKTSGSTGKPVLWPRGLHEDMQLVSAFERVYQQCFQIQDKKTLHAIQIFFSTNPAGMVTAQLSYAASKNHALTTVTPGANIERTLTMIEMTGHLFDQVIVSTYPPYVLPLLDHAEKMGVSIEKYRLKFFCTGEKFSEGWRNSVVARLGENASRHDIVSSYGCAEAGLVGCESPLTIDLLNAVADKPHIGHSIFGTKEVPTVFAYNPLSKFLEVYSDTSQNLEQNLEQNSNQNQRDNIDSTCTQELLMTVDQVVPLIRFNIQDRGGLLTGSELNSAITKHSLPIEHAPKDANFVYLFGRSDSVSFSVINIYVEEVQSCLERTTFSDRFTGEFQYGNIMDERYQDEMLIVIYVKQGQTIHEHEQKQLHQEIWDNLTALQPSLLLFPSEVINSNMLHIETRPPRENGLPDGKYKYFLQ